MHKMREDVRFITALQCVVRTGRVQKSEEDKK